LYYIYNSLTNIVKIIELLSGSEFKKELYKLFSKTQIKQFVSSINQIENKFNIEVLKVSNLVEVKNSFYLQGIYYDLDNLSEQIDNSIGMIDKLSNVLEKLCPDVTLSIKHNDRDGYYLNTTKIRGEKLEKELSKQKKNFKLGSKEIKYDELDFKYQTNTCKITYSGLSDHSDEIDELYGKLDTKIKEYFFYDTIKWYTDNSVILKDLTNMIVQLDIITNNAFTSSKYHYVKPILKSNSNSSINFYLS
jgi:DNA mismatch repair ATPase MutS